MKYSLAAVFLLLAPAVAAAQVYVSGGDGTYRASPSLAHALGYRQTSYVFRPAPAPVASAVYVQSYDYHALFEDRVVTPDAVIESRFGFFGSGALPVMSRSTSITPRP